MATTPTTPSIPSADRAAAEFASSAPAATPATPAAASTPATPATQPATSPATPPVTPAVDAPVADAASLDGIADLLKDDLVPAADPAAPIDPLEALKDNPRVQELIGHENTIKEALKLSAYLKEPAHIADAIRDADIIWKISDGKENISVILEAARAEAARLNTPERFQKILGDFKTYYEQLTGQPLAAAAAGQPTPALTPEQQRLAAVEKELTDRKTAETKAATAKRITTARSTIMENINTALKGTWLDGEGERMLGLIGSQLGADSTMKIVEAAERKNFTEITKALTTARNQEAVLFKARIERMIAAKKAKQATIPNQVAGGTPAASPEPGEQKVEMDKEKRVAQMTAQFQGR